MEAVDLTLEFRKYREAIRLIWNVFLADYDDQEDVFPDIDRALFQALLESKLDTNLLKESTPDGIKLFYNLDVESPEKNALELKRDPGLNVWREVPLPVGPVLKYVGMFDFDSFSGVTRDFQYIRCAFADEQSSGPKWRELLIVARNARVLYVGSSSSA